MIDLKISKTQSRHIIIESQGLNQHSTSLDVINQLGYVQIDTLSVAERAHHHVIQARNPDYEKSDLADLMSSQKVFEYWSHAAAYLPISDYKYSLIKKATLANGASHWFPKNKKVEQHVLERVTAEGRLQSKDFKDTRNSDGEWYDYKPAKVVLEQLFMEGKLMIAERKNFQKVYDLTERVLPSDTDTTPPTISQFCEYLIMTTIKSQGIANIPEIGYLRKGIKPSLIKTMNELVESGSVQTLAIDGVDEAYYMLSKSTKSNNPSALHILSPFDNLVIQRKRLHTLFNFQYQIECYVPETKRKFGYYVLPILYKDQFVARLDPKADRKTGILTVKNIWFENGFLPDDNFNQSFSEKLRAFATFCGCQRIKIEKCSPTKFAKSLRAAVKKS